MIEGAESATYEGYLKAHGKLGIPVYLYLRAMANQEPPETWQGHLGWLKKRFDGARFTAADVLRLANEAWPEAIPMPGQFTSKPADAGYTRLLGAEYAKLASQPDGPLRIVAAGRHAKITHWMVEDQREDPAGGRRRRVRGNRGLQAGATEAS